ncbi:MAG: hypothetical protein GQ534_12150 [Candidatus Delongbacteria bacterium]|nr:hypothetical protein [Candidatus Delongbacteria bacterium]
MRKKGKILRVKQGYNPNSSSMGSIIFAFPAALMGIAAGFSIISGIIMSKLVKKDTGEQAKEVKE